MLSGCRFVFVADLSASATAKYLAALREDGGIAPLDARKDAYTKSELAAADNGMVQKRLTKGERGASAPC